MNSFWLHAIRRAIVALLIVALLPLAQFPSAVSVSAQDDGIDSAALLHDSRDDLYRTPTGAVPVETSVTLRFRTAAHNVDSVTARIYDTLTDSQIMLPLAVVTTTPEGTDLWEATFDVGKAPTVYSYRFLVSKGGDTLYYEDDTRPGDGAYFPANEGGPGAAYETSLDLGWQITAYDPDYYTPEWMRNAVVYQIFPDRFRNGDTANDPADDELEFYDGLFSVFHETWNEQPVDPRLPGEYENQWNVDFFGGDLAGVIEKLDYLQDLGVTAIYLNPIFEARSNHRYDTADYKVIDPLLGDLETFQTLVAEAEARGIVLILDGVFNHMSSDSPIFDRYGRYEEDGACESADSLYRNWFFFIPPKGLQPSPCVDNPQGATFYESWAGYDSIPKINSEHAGPRLYFFTGRNSVVNTWGREGIGGWRLDVGGDIDSGPGSDYWEGFRNAVRNANPEGVIIGEEWHNASKWLLGDEWDSVMNYRLRRGILGYVRDENFTDNDANGDNVIHALTPSELEGIIRDIESDYPPMAYHAMMNILDSHDTSRLLYVAGDTERQKLAALLQFALPGAPTIYYGDEIALDAPSVDAGGTVQDDPYNRAPYPWADTEGDAYGPADEDMLAYYQGLAGARNVNAALREGDMITLVADDDSGIYAFLRRDLASGNMALIAVNNSDEEQSVELDFTHKLPTGLSMWPTVGWNTSFDTGSGSTVITLPANSGNIWLGDAGSAITTPKPPANLQTQGAINRVSLSWDAVEGASGYLVYRSPVATGGFELISDSVEEPAFVDDSAINGYRYYYAVAALSETGLSGAMSSSAEALPTAQITRAEFVPGTLPETITYGYGVTVDVAAAVVVEGLTGINGPADGVQAEAAFVPPDSMEAAEWFRMDYTGALDDADRYDATIPVPAQAGEDWKIWVRFSINAGESWTLATYEGLPFPTLTILAPEDTISPEAPASAEIVEATPGGVILRWEASPSDDVAAYAIYRTQDDETTLIAEIPAGDEARYHDKAVTPGNAYGYAIAALDAALNQSEPLALGEATVQHRRIPVTFVVTVPDYTKEGPGDLYIAGDFGASDIPNWDPAGIVMTQIDDQHWTVTLDLPEGATIQYKYVRGTWNAVEKGTECEEIANRTLTVDVAEGETELLVDWDVVAKWRDLDKCG